MNTEAKMQLMKRTTAAVLRHVVSLWPFSKYICKMLTLQQRKMVTCMMCLRRSGQQPVHEFHKHRFRAAGRLIVKHNADWAALWAKQSIDWEKHLRRDWERQAQSLSMTSWTGGTSFSFASALFNFHPSSWLEPKRVFFSRRRGNQGVCSRTNTRSTRVVATRFEDGASNATSWLYSQLLH